VPVTHKAKNPEANQEGGDGVANAQERQRRAEKRSNHHYAANGQRVAKRELLKKNPDWVWTAREVIPTAKGFVLKWIATIPVQSCSATIEGLDILELREDKITRNEVYFDRSALLKL
jgi:hypothetical protein